MENPAIWITASGELWGIARGGNMAAYARDWKNWSTWTREMPGPTSFSGSHDTEVRGGRGQPAGGLSQPRGRLAHVRDAPPA
jgi:hypothetical protein